MRAGSRRGVLAVCVVVALVAAMSTVAEAPPVAAEATGGWSGSATFDSLQVNLDQPGGYNERDEVHTDAFTSSDGTSVVHYSRDFLGTTECGGGQPGGAYSKATTDQTLPQEFGVGVRIDQAAGWYFVAGGGGNGFMQHSETGGCGAPVIRYDTTDGGTGFAGDTETCPNRVAVHQELPADWDGRTLTGSFVCIDANLPSHSYMSVFSFRLTLDPDRDHDGVPDTTDQCPDDPNATANGCPPPADGDGDGVPDDVDQCPNTFPGFPVDAVGCPSLPDADHDGTPDVIDQCANTPAGTRVNATGCPDSDGDQFPDPGHGAPGTQDGCPSDPGPASAEGCPDSDGDSFPDPGHNAPGTEDQCPTDPATEGSTDGCPIVTAVPDWTMPDRTLDLDHNGFIDDYIAGSQSAIVPVDGKYNVLLDGCGSFGSINTWDWVVDGRSFSTHDCSLAVKSREGDFDASLTVTGPDASASQDFTLRVHDQLIVGLGDSFGSGEGAPGGTITHQRWAQQPCHRSVRSGQAVAALRLEQADPRSSVTFIHLACSGATGPKGIYGWYTDPPGDPRIGEIKAQEPQIVAARRLAHFQTIDAVFLSIGGNDIGFSDTILTCARFATCPSEHRRFHGAQVGPLDLGTITVHAHTLHDEAQTKLQALRSHYDQVARCLSYSAVGTCPHPKLGVTASRVFVTEYPNLATNDFGGYCDSVLRPPFNSGIADEELQWATEVLQQGIRGQTFTLDVNLGPDPTFDVSQPGLNTQINNLGRLGWRPIGGIAQPFIRHGICAIDQWVNTLEASYAKQHDNYGTFHPNQAGYQTYADAITPVVQSALGIVHTP